MHEEAERITTCPTPGAWAELGSNRAAVSAYGFFSLGEVVVGHFPDRVNALVAAKEKRRGYQAYESQQERVLHQVLTFLLPKKVQAKGPHRQSFPPAILCHS